MNIEDIKGDKELVRKLNSLHRSLTVLMKDSIHHDKFSYKEHEINITLDAKAVNQHIAENRMNKIKALMDLSKNWDEFKILYKDDLILKKIGVEFLEGKFEFNEEILDTLKKYPHRKEVLYYFTKGVDVNLSDAKPEDYHRIKRQVLSDIQEEALTHLQQKKLLIKAIGKMVADKSQDNLDYISSLTDDSNPNGRMSVDYAQGLAEILNRVKIGDFIAQKDESQMIVELPIAGVKQEGQNDVKSSTVLFRVDLENPKEYSIQVGSLQSLNASIEDKINAIREKALSFKSSDNSPNFG